MPENTDSNLENPTPHTGHERCVACGGIKGESHQCAIEEVSAPEVQTAEGEVKPNVEQVEEPHSPEANPTQSAVEINQRASEVQSVVPKQSPTHTVEGGKVPHVKPGIAKKIGREKNAKGRKKFLLGCMGGFIFIFVLFIILMVLMISRSGASNPVLAAYNLGPGGIRNFLQLVVGLSFGSLALLFLVLTVIGLFRLLSAQKSDKEKRRRNGRMMGVSTFSLIFIVFIWTLLATFIGRIEIVAERVLAEIIVVSPKDLSALEAPVEIRFSASNVATALAQSGVKVEAMSWDLDGDGVYETAVGNDPEVTHLYNQKGVVRVGLQVRSVDEVEPIVFTQVVSIQDALFDATPSEGTAPLEVQFDTSSLIEKSDIASLDWDFDGDGLYEIEGPDNLRPRYTFDKIGSYVVSLRVIDKNNNVENYKRTIKIVPSSQPLLSAEIDVTPGVSGAVPLQLQFNGDRSESLKGTVTKYEWNFGDGSALQSGKSVSHIFEAAGLYSVNLKVTDSLQNEATTIVEIEVMSISSIPEAIIDTDPQVENGAEMLEGVIPFKVEFDATNSTDADDDIVDYEWDFDGDGEIDVTGAKVEHQFEEAGNFAVRLTVRDAEGQVGNKTLNVVVQEPGVQAVISLLPEEGTVPLSVQFDGSSSSTFTGNIVSYEWDFGDGSPKTLTGATVSHKYNSIGTYEAKLKVLTNNNEWATTSQLIYVREIPLKACFTPSRINGSAPLTVSFDSSCSTGAISQYDYQYGDGAESVSANPTHTFNFPGTYTVIFEVTDDKNNINTYQKVIVAEGEVE